MIPIPATSEDPLERDAYPMRMLTHAGAGAQTLQQYTYDPTTIDEALRVGDMKKMSAQGRLDFYRAVCLSVGLNPLTQPFIVLERQDKTTWLYATAVAAQQLAALHKVSYRDIHRRHEIIQGDPMYTVEVTATLPDGRSLPAQGVVSLTRKKRVARGTWPNGEPKWSDALDDEGDPVLVPLRGEALANAIMKTESKCLRRATLALVGLGWMLVESEGRPRTMHRQTGELGDSQAGRQGRQAPDETSKTQAEHIRDLYGEGGVSPTAPQPREGGKSMETEIEDIVQAAGGTLATYWAWALKRCGRTTRDTLTSDDYALLLQLARLRAAAQQRAAAPAPLEGETVDISGMVEDAEDAEDA